MELKFVGAVVACVLGVACSSSAVDDSSASGRAGRSPKSSASNDAAPAAEIAASEEARAELGIEGWRIYRGQTMTYVAAMRADGLAKSYARLVTIAAAPADANGIETPEQVELRFEDNTNKPARVVFVNGGAMVADLASEEQLGFAKHAARDLAHAKPITKGCAADLTKALPSTLTPMFECAAANARTSLRMSLAGVCESADRDFKINDSRTQKECSATSKSGLRAANLPSITNAIGTQACPSCEGTTADIAAMPEGDGYGFMATDTAQASPRTTGVELAAAKPAEPDMCSNSEWISSVAGTFTGTIYCIQEGAVIAGGCIIAGAVTLGWACAAAVGSVIYEEMLPSPLPQCKDLPENLHTAVGLSCQQQRMQEHYAATAAQYDHLLNGCERSDAVCLNNWCFRQVGATGKYPDGCAELRCLAAAQARLSDAQIQQACAAQAACNTEPRPATATGCGTMLTPKEEPAAPTLSKTDCGDKSDGWWCLDAGDGPGWMAYCEGKQVSSGCACAGCTTAGVKASCAAAAPPAACPE